MQQIYSRTPLPKLISIKLVCNATETTLRHGFSPVNLLHIFSTSFDKNTSRGLLLIISVLTSICRKCCTLNSIETNLSICLKLVYKNYPIFLEPYLALLSFKECFSIQNLKFCQIVRMYHHKCLTDNFSDVFLK